ncbi:MAG TPA: ABC transporter ATP-binding protein [Alphaproteobacteria bacterium]|nr:ABC transporter ATP-binding protein [Alphaproteobacteria bacterium]
MPNAALELDSVTRRFGPVVAVDRISLAIQQDEFFALLGPSGSGKTTMLRLIAGLEQPNEGEVRIAGQVVTDLPPYRRGVGMVFQNFLLFPHKTVAENIIFPLRMQKMDKARQQTQLGWIVELLHLQGLDGRFPHELSGGQQQRVALARGLISRPALLLLDEPLANLDRELRSEMEVEIRRYQKELKIPFVYVTHNQEEALTMSDRIAVMRNGRFEQIGAKTEIYTNPASAFVATFVGHANRLDGEVTEIDGTLARMKWAGGMLLVPRPAKASPGDRVRYFIKHEDLEIMPAAANGHAANDLNQISGTLRDIIFKGQTANYIIALPQGSDLVVSDTPRTIALKPSDPVVVRWPAGSGSCFTAEGV